MILGRKVVSEWREHRNESVAPICQGNDAELVEDVSSVRDSGEQPIKIVFINALREECDDSEKRRAIRAKVLE